MDPSELMSLKQQVADLETALLSDPNNEDLLTCKTELLELISLTETLLQQEQQLADESASVPTAATPVAKSSPVVQAHGGGVSATSSPYRTTTSTASGSGASTPTKSTTTPTSTATASKGSNQPIYQPPAPTRHWSVGDRCRALYAEDGKYYEATILAVADGHSVYSIQYTGYADSPPVTLGPENLKPIYDPKKHQQHTPPATAGTGDSGEVKTGQKRGPDGSGASAAAGAGAGAGAGGGMKKKKKTDAGPSEQVQKQMAWQNFAKGAKKGKTGGGVGLKKSIFATPDNPEGKVGVVGSGKGMTQFQQRGKHLYGNTDLQ
ncbi:hypothetical protein BG015_000874 [Linnemannia schmuckeri]|uniref:Tudor domain-containing protein n=1 Tax=Linnemannia schmuckeri TaxID=64567 RepID=A0A9P5VDZ4_9FUNG|nr:hypothetical protein BG015_000874 [Linnemannia schmuckeri]